MMKFSVDHPRSSVFVKALIFGAGTSYVRPAEKEFRVSKLEGPRLGLELLPIPALETLPKYEPAEAVSIEWDHE